ncbi:MAG: DNA polymerase III subunit delta [Candidatus Krumholzibacteriia bacterium]|nr:DNA polymerase III subunit delta [bacterium]MCB9515113.1 DNA polymerase III subunit delta [Candidatus Latescibacterota bacterium]
MAARGARSSSDPLAPLRADLAKGIRPSYLFTGESDWVRREAVRLLRDACVPEESRQFSYEERTLDRFADWAEIEALLRSYSFFDPRKLVHLEVGSKLDDDFRAALSRFLDEAPGQNVLCLSAPNLEQLMAAKNRVVKQKGLALKFENMSAAALTDWTAARLREQGLDFAPGLPARLVAALPPDPGEIAGEIDKLRLACPPGHRLQPADLDRLVGVQRLEDVWRLTELLRPGREAEAMALLHELLGSGLGFKSMLGALNYSITMLLRARLLLDEGLPPARAAAALPTYPQRAREAVDRAKALKKRELLTWILNLQKLDVRLLHGSAALERELVEITLLASLRGEALRG